MRKKMICSLVLILTPGFAAAQTQDADFKVRCVADPAKVAKALQDAANNQGEPKITGRDICVAGEPEYKVNSEIVLAVEHTEEQSFNENGQPNPGDLVLFLDGKSLHATHPRLGPSVTDADSVTTTLLTYRISHDVTTDEARANWKEVLTGRKSRKRMTVSTGLESGAAAASQATILFTAISTGKTLAFAGIAAVAIIIFLVIAGKTGALRDKEPAGPEIKQEKDRAYSLSRCQIALWTMIVLLSYLFVWVLTGEYNTPIPASVVTLLGLGLGTFGLAAALDAGKVTSNQEKLAKVRKLKLTGAATAAELPDEGELEKGTKVAPSEGVAKDLVTSAQGTSLHRLQFAVWTVALMAVFVVTVWRTLGMPDFDSTLLALMGISSGTYVGLKIPESKS